jgi:hypothetical protein
LVQVVVEPKSIMKAPIGMTIERIGADGQIAPDALDGATVCELSAASP